ncbi:MAG: hypothetical protein JO244_08395 [Solirubrobacterales bacterium]|nr:hypothetical protein [Solirubrobacterales bacterium]
MSSHASGLIGGRLLRAGTASATAAVVEPLGVLLLPGRLEELEFAPHARELLDIPRVIALEPGRVRTPRFLRDAAPARQARRLRLPGEPRVVVLYHPLQYPLARSLCARYERSELWYLRCLDPAGDRDLTELDELAQARALEVRPITSPEERSAAEAALRQRLRELGIITHRPFFPDARIGRR